LLDAVVQVALSAELRAAAGSAEASGDDAAPYLRRAVGEAGALLEEVRSVAHGIYPAILGDAGLAPALASLVDLAPLPIELDPVSTRRYPPAVEAAIYRLVAEAIDNAAAHADATWVAVAIGEVAETLEVRVRDDGRGGAVAAAVGGLAELADRVGALGGTIAIESPAGGGTTISAGIPCAS
jgi:signal transduction histidine kinase